MVSVSVNGIVFILSFIVIISCGRCEEAPVPNATARVNRLSDQITAVIEHYKSADPVGLPIVPIPDPMPIPEIKNSIGFGSTLRMYNQSVHGLSKFKIEYVYSNLADMEMSMLLRIDILQVLGNYTFTTFISKAEGASNSTLTGLTAEGIAMLEVAREGNLEAVDVDLDLTVADIDVQLENPGILGSVLQGFMNTIGTLVFDAVKPFIMNEININILGDVNKNLKSLKTTFPNSLSPVDVGFAEGRKFVRRMGYDPFKVNDFTHTTGVLGISVTNIWLTGLASFHRVGNITVTMENNTVYFGVAVGTQQLEGKCNWEISMAGLVSTLGKIDFTIEYLEVKTKINQTLDIRNKPNLEDLDVTLGNFQIQFDGAGTLDYVIEAIVNILPNLLRYQIMLAVEEPLKAKVQEIFNDIDVEKVIKEQAKQMEGSLRGDPDVKEGYPHEEGLSIDESRLDEVIF